MHTPPDFDLCDGLVHAQSTSHAIATIIGVSENSVQVRAQAVAMATKHPEL